MSGFHESLDAALGRAGERDARDDLADAFYESVSWDDLIDGRWIHDPHGLCGHLANLAAQRIEQAKAEERERIASAIEREDTTSRDEHAARDAANTLGRSEWIGGGVEVHVPTPYCSVCQRGTSGFVCGPCGRDAS